MNEVHILLIVGIVLIVLLLGKEMRRGDVLDRQSKDDKKNRSAGLIYSQEW